VLVDVKPQDSPLRPEAAKLMQQAANRDAAVVCETVPGFPLAGLLSEPIKIIQAPRTTIILYEVGNLHRQVFSDGRTLPSEFNFPAFLGYSVGRWVDDYTFVADSNGFDDRSWLDNAGRPHSDALHVMETYHRVDADHLEKTITIDDPKYYTRPWVALDKLPYRLQSASLEIPEQECVPSETTKYNQLFANPAAGVKP
jgi:hypothetical protein